MLKIHHTVTTSFRGWGPDITESEPNLASPTNLTPDENSVYSDSWVDVEQLPELSPFGHSGPASVYSGLSTYISRADLNRNTPTIDPTASVDIPATEWQDLDTNTFPPHATHLLPSEPNGTWRTQTGYAMKNPIETASKVRQVIKQQTHEHNMQSLRHQLEQVAEAPKDRVEEWLNRTLADCDLVEMHHRVRGLVPVLSTPNIRQVDHVVEALGEMVQSLGTRRSEPELLDKYTFARIIGHEARKALIEQGICKEWQFLSKEHEKLQDSMHAALVQTYIRTKQSPKDVSLVQAKPRWIADRERNVWWLELDVDAIDVGVNPETDVSVVELGFVSTGFSLPESCSCVSLADLERGIQPVDKGWQLLEG
jgi:hypothetical protein